jgi:uncharacterized membrane protein YkoI
VAGLSVGAAEAQRPFGGRFDVEPQRWSPDDAREGVRNGRIRPLGEILREVESQIPGRMLGRAELQELPGGRTLYHLRWQTPDGRLLNLTIDAESGAIQR